MIDDDIPLADLGKDLKMYFSFSFIQNIDTFPLL